MTYQRPTLDEFLHSGHKIGSIEDSGIWAEVELIEDASFLLEDGTYIESDVFVIELPRAERPGEGMFSNFMDNIVIPNPLLQDRAILLANIGHGLGAKGVHKYMDRRHGWQELGGLRTRDQHFIFVR